MPSLVFVLFLAGLLTILLPCILPLLPIVLGVSIAGRSKLRPLMTVLGMLVSFVASTFLLNVLLSQFVELADIVRIGTYEILFLFGVGFLFQNRIALFIGGLLGGLFFWNKGIPTVLIASIAGVIAMEIGGRVASKLQQVGTNAQGLARTELGDDNLLTAFLIGCSMGLVWVPCAGPALGFVLTIVREQPGSVAALYLLSYAIGAGIPLLFIGYGGQAAVKSVRSIARFSGRIKQVAGVLLILSALGLQSNYFVNLQTSTSFGNLGNAIEQSLFGSRSDDEGEIDVTQKLPVLRNAPQEFAGLGQWFNSEPLNLADLKGKVVLIDFWTYSCINCIRTLPYIEAYWDKHKDQPFVLIGVHTPEFTFEKSPGNVQSAINKYGLTYPIVQDNDFKTWNAFQNRYWPAKYLIDAEGRIRYQHFGEGKYEETDMAIQSLLREIGAGSGSTMELPAMPTDERKPTTRETYLHSRSWEAFVNGAGFPDDKEHAYVMPTSVPLHTFALSGNWQLVDDERQVLLSNEGDIRINALAGEVNLVLGLEGDTKPVKADVFVDGKLFKTITIQGHDLYELFKGDYGNHDILLKIRGKNVGAYAFTFGS